MRYTSVCIEYFEYLKKIGVIQQRYSNQYYYKYYIIRKNIDCHTDIELKAGDYIIINYGLPSDLTLNKNSGMGNINGCSVAYENIIHFIRTEKLKTLYDEV